MSRSASAERGEHLRGGPAVAALLQPGHVLHADPGEGGQLGPAQAGRTAAGAGGQPHLGGGDGFPAERRNRPSSFSLTLRTVQPRRRIVALPLPASARPPSPVRRASKDGAMSGNDTLFERPLPRPLFRAAPDPWRVGTRPPYTRRSTSPIRHLGISKVRGRFHRVHGRAVRR